MLTKLRKGAASVGVAGVLAVSIGLGQAAPANAVLPLIPVAAGAVGGTAAGAAISGWAIAGYAALTAGVLSASLAIQENGAVWFEDAVKFFEGDPAQKKTVEAPPQPVPEGTSPDDGSFVWFNSMVTIQGGEAGITWDKYQYSGAPRPVNRVTYTITYSGSGIKGNLSGTPDQHNMHVLPTLVTEATCKRHSDGSTYQQVRYYKLPYIDAKSRTQTQSTGGCSDVANAEVIEWKLRPATTFEKLDPVKFNISRSDAFWHNYSGIDREWFSKAPGTSYGDPGYRATVQCTKPDGSKVALTLDSAYVAGGGQVGIPSCKAAGYSEIADSLTIDYIDGTRTVQPLYRTKPQTDPMLQCDVAFGNSCQLEIEIDGMPCVVGTVQCAGWVSQHLADPSRVKCFYAGREVSISNCGLLEGAYVYGGSPWTKNNTDGDPGTWDDPLKVPGWTPKIGPNGEPAIAPNADPENPTQPNPNAPPEPEPEPSPSPSPSPPPTEGEPEVSTPPFPTHGTNPSDPCLNQTWSWNPSDWVKSPVVCALKDVFIPKTDISARVTELGDIAGTKAPVSWLNPTMVGPGGGGCPNWVVNVPGFSQNVVCGSSFTAAIVGARGPLFGLVAGAMVWPLFRSLWYAAIPILRVTPASSK